MSEAPHFRPEAPQFQRDILERYLRTILGPAVRLLGITRLGGAQEGKGFGYGVPLRLEYETVDGRRESAVLHTMEPGAFGHEHMADRARVLLWSHQAFNRLPRHIRSFDVGGFITGGGLLPLGRVEEFCLLTEFAEGQPYALDLERLRESGELTDLDVARADVLCDYLSEVHAERSSNAGLYLRRNRELVGDGECIMGLADSFPPHPLFTPTVLEDIEQRAVSWRWRLKNRTHRLRRIHGDFHPWNILFAPATVPSPEAAEFRALDRSGGEFVDPAPAPSPAEFRALDRSRGDDADPAPSPAEFRLLDRSRGEYGDPADDVTSITINYLFFSLQRAGKLEGAFERLFLRFWDRYLEKTGDREILEVAAPFFVFRALVLANPVWYPDLQDAAREKLLRFILAVLGRERFDPHRVNAYCGI